MHRIKRSGFILKNNLSSALKSHNDYLPWKGISHMRVADFSSIPTHRTPAIRDFSKRVFQESAGVPFNTHIRAFNSPYHLAKINRFDSQISCFAKSFTSKASESTRKPNTNSNSNSEILQKLHKEVSKVEDPFDAPTYNIPEKPVTFTEGASYSFVILIGLGLALAAAYAVFKELIFQPKEYKIFDKALVRIQNDGQVRVRIGSPITGYGSESRNRSARQRVPNKIWVDEDGVEHVEVNFYIRGPHGGGKVYTEMFNDKVDNKWKFTYLIVEIKSPSTAQLMLESYIPA